METYQLDRILTWLSSAIGFNDKSDKKYFYDIEEKTFFNLGFRDNKYYQWTNQIHLSREDSKTIQFKITKLTEDKTDFIEICKSDTRFNALLTQRPETKEEYDERDYQWRLLHKEVETFLTQHCIDIYFTRLIE